MRDPKTLTRWIAFKLAPRPNGTVEKTPINVNGGLAACDNPATWASYDDARAFAATHQDHCLGFVLGKEVGLVVFDIDKARPAKDAAWPEWVEREVAELDSFTEMSVSGLGRHVWVWGSIPANRHNKARQVELHDSNKMFCVSQEFAENWTAIKERDLAELYARVDSGRIGPDYKPAPIVHSYNDAKFNALMAGNLAPYFESRSEAVASVLCTLAVKHAGNRQAMRTEFEESALCEAWGEKWERLGDKELDHAIKWFNDRMVKAAFRGQALTFASKFIPRQRGVREYILKPREKFDGWFPRGSVSIIGGPSGAGKTTVMLDLLNKQSKKEAFLNHAGGELPYLVLFADREEEDNEETLERMNLHEAGMDMECLPWCWDFEAVTAILGAIEKRNPMPRAVLVEGGDMLPSEPTKLPVVAQLVKYLQQMAKHYRIALVLSVGAPKAAPDAQHTLLRDRIFGSQIWGRMASTIVTMSIPDGGNGTGTTRQLDVQHRNAGSEKYTLEFSNGLLVPRVTKVDLGVFELWACQQDKFDFPAAMGAMEKRSPRLNSKPNMRKKIEQLIEAGAIVSFVSKEDDGIECFRWVHEDSSAAVALEQSAGA